MISKPNLLFLSPIDAEAMSWPEDHVDVWSVDLDLLTTRYAAALQPWLNAEERARLDRLVPIPAKGRFLAMRGVLRWLLATYLQSEPQEIDLGYSDHGKPFLAGPNAGASRHFNLSHSRHLGLIAIGPCELGIDIEFLRDDLAMTALVERYFSASERDEFQAQTASAKTPWFFRCWTRKEAVLKACGLGIQLPLDAVETGGADRDTVLSLKDTAWLLRDVPQENAAASLATPTDRNLLIQQRKIVLDV